MNDVALINMIATRIEGGLPSITSSSVAVVKSSQPTQQGINTGNNVFISKIYKENYGYPILKTQPQTDGTFNEVETQIVCSYIRISGLFPEKPGDTSIPTAGDVLEFLKMYLSSRATIREFKENGASILRVKEVMNREFYDDQSQFEDFPYFDIAIVHNQQITTTEIPAIVAVEGNFLVINNGAILDYSDIAVINANAFIVG